MKVLFKNKTQYTKQIYKEFLEFHQEKYGMSYYLYTIGFIIAFLFCIVEQLKTRNYILSIITLLALTAFVLWRFYNPRKTVEKELKSKKIEKEQEFIFKFYENNFVIYSQKINSKVRYFRLYKIFETSDYFYLYIDKTHAFLISKDGFEFGTPEEFSEFIHKKCILKYKQVKD